MGLFTRNDLDAATAASLAGFLGFRPRVLAWGRTTTGVGVGLSDRLTYLQGEQWGQQVWHEVARGGWEESSGRLQWTDVQGREGSLLLTEPRRLPDLFNERVSASIVLQKIVDLGRGRSAVVSLRRDLGSPGAPLVWRVRLGSGVDQDDPVVVGALTAELDRLRTEYDIA